MPAHGPIQPCVEQADRFSLAGELGECNVVEVRFVYAVVETGGKQYRVTVGQTIDVEKITAAPGEGVTLDKVLLIGDGDKVDVGKPTVKGAVVSATVVKHGLRRKAIIFHYMPKQRYRVKRGFRQEYTRLRIDEIRQ